MGRGTLTPQEEKLKKLISNNIRTKIKEEGISQAEFARRAGIPPTTLSGYIKGVTRPNAGNLQKIADTLGVLKSDIDPSYKQGYSLENWNNNIKSNSPIVEEITKVTSQLEEPRQKIVLETANAQLKEQNEKENRKNKVVRLKKKRLTDEELWEVIEHGVANDGSEQTEYEKQFFFNLLRENLDNDDEYED